MTVFTGHYLLGFFKWRKDQPHALWKESHFNIMRVFIVIKKVCNTCTNNISIVLAEFDKTGLIPAPPSPPPLSHPSFSATFNWFLRWPEKISSAACQSCFQVLLASLGGMPYYWHDFQSAVGHDYQTDLSKHSSQVDTAKGFGGKFGVQKDRVDKASVLWFMGDWLGVLS